jgi:hypothetical protein
LLEQELKVGLGLKLTRKDDGSAVGGGKMNIDYDHLHRVELLQEGTRS